MKLRVFTSFSGYDSQCMALDRLVESQKQKVESGCAVEPFTYELIGWSEIDKYAIQAHNAIYPQWADRNYGNICNIDWAQVPDFDLLTYSSPCQDFSQAGKQAGGEKGSGTRSSLLWECERAIREKRPKYLLMENVAALVSKKFVGLFNQWQLTLERYGYVNFAKVLNAKDYGVPQNRERIFLVSILDEGDNPRYEFPKPFRLDKRLKDLLEQQVEEKYYISAKIIDYIERHNAAGYTKSVDGLDGKGEISNALTVAGLTKTADHFVSDKIQEPQCELVGMIESKAHESTRRVYSDKGVAPTLNCCEGGNMETKIVESTLVSDSERL